MARLAIEADLVAIKIPDVGGKARAALFDQSVDSAYIFV